MKTALIAAASLAALAPALPAQAQSQVRIRNAVARVVVMIEDRAEVAVEIQPGSALQPLAATRSGDRLDIDGGLPRRAIRECRSGPAGARQPGEGASVEVARTGRVDLSAAPLVLVRSPPGVRVQVGDNAAVFGAVGRGARSVSLASAGCGDWVVADVGGDLELSLAGSGDVRTGDAATAEVNLAGSGDVALGALRSLQANIAGSGDIATTRVDGPVEANIAGSGDIRLGSGSITRLSANIAGSGDISAPGAVGSLSANIIGSGDVAVGSVTGPVDRSVMGSGSVRIGR